MWYNQSISWFYKISFLAGFLLFSPTVPACRGRGCPSAEAAHPPAWPRKKVHLLGGRLERVPGLIRSRCSYKFLAISNWYICKNELGNVIISLLISPGMSDMYTVDCQWCHRERPIWKYPESSLQLLMGLSRMIPKLQGERSMMLFLSAKTASLTGHHVNGSCPATSLTIHSIGSFSTNEKLNRYQTDLYFLELSHQMTNVCLLISDFLPAFDCSCMLGT